MVTSKQYFLKIFKTPLLVNLKKLLFVAKVYKQQIQNTFSDLSCVENVNTRKRYKCQFFILKLPLPTTVNTESRTIYITLIHYYINKSLH